MHELGHLIYEIEYSEPLSDDVLLTLAYLNDDQTLAEIRKILHYLSQYPSPSIELLAFIEVKSINDIETSIQLNDYEEKHSKEQLIKDLYLFQLFSHFNLLRGYDFSTLNEINEVHSTTFLN